MLLYSTEIKTPLGTMYTLASKDSLYILDFIDGKNVSREITKLKANPAISITEGRTKITDMIEGELETYFEGTLKEFKTPLHASGSGFQQSVMQILQDIPFGQTRSYGEQAHMLGRPTAVRAVAAANGRNRIAIAIPCHRVIGANGKLTGYAGGLKRKEWLLEHEAKCA